MLICIIALNTQRVDSYTMHRHDITMVSELRETIHDRCHSPLNTIHMIMVSGLAQTIHIVAGSRIDNTHCNVTHIPDY